jgi:hypothetical protein
LELKTKAFSGGAFAKVDALVQEVRDWYKQINELMGEDIFNQRQKDTVAGNEKYAPFRVLKHMEEFVTAGMIHQVGTLSDIRFHPRAAAGNAGCVECRRGCCGARGVDAASSRVLLVTYW